MDSLGDVVDLHGLAAFKVGEARGLRVTLKTGFSLGEWTVLPEEARVAQVPTANIDAPYAYQLGRQSMARRTVASLEEAAAQFRIAIQHDPDYAEAHVGLADTILLLNFYGGLPQEEALPVMEAHVATALSLNASLGEAHTSKGALHQFVPG